MEVSRCDGVSMPDCKTLELIFRRDSRKCVFSNRVVDNWNSLSTHCINFSTINTFKMHVSSELKSGAIIVIVGVIWRKHVLTYAGRVHVTLLASVNSVNVQFAIGCPSNKLWVKFCMCL